MIREILSLPRLSATSPDDAAAVWLARRAHNPLQGEEEAFALWLAADPANREAWEQAEAAWRCFDTLGEDELLEAIREKAREAGPEPRDLPFARVFAAAAAAILLMLASAAIWLHTGGNPQSPPRMAQAAPDPLERFGAPDYVTAKGQQRTVRLSDGSRLTLDTASAVDIAFQPTRRALTLLRGRGSFQVAHDVSRPFTVRAGDIEVVAIGTRFDVRLEPNLVRVTLIEGRVAVQSLNGRAAPVTLRAGEQLTERSGGVTVSRPNLQEALDWPAGLVTFRNDTLAAAAAELNRYSSTALVVRDPRVARLRVTGSFKAGDPGRFARTVEQIHPVRSLRREGGAVELVSSR
ncbi:MAG TPA: FecR domain-containing protein [Allosphingosinicella sp.]|jgi:transmembrane sensor